VTIQNSEDIRSDVDEVDAPNRPLDEVVVLDATTDGDTTGEVDEDEDEDDGGSGVSQSPYDRPGRWYVVHTYSGYENKVKGNLANVITSRQMEDRVFETVIPMEDVVEFKAGKKVVVQKKVFPGYLLVRCDLDDDTWGRSATPGRHRLRRPGHQAHAAVAPRGGEHPPGQA